jgi:hypothetical protein
MPAWLSWKAVRRGTSHNDAKVTVVVARTTGSLRARTSHAGQLRKEDSRSVVDALAAALRDLAGRMRALVTLAQRATTH